MLKELAGGAHNNTILVPHSPAAVTDLSEQIRNSMLISQQPGAQSAAEGS